MFFHHFLSFDLMKERASLEGVDDVSGSQSTHGIASGVGGAANMGQNHAIGQSEQRVIQRQRLGRRHVQPGRA